MKTLAIAIAVAALIGTPAFAADMPLKAPPPAPAPVYSWTGWYAGVNLGASFGHVKTDFNAAPVDVTTVVPPGGFFLTPGLAGSDISHPSGFIGGGQIGYNWQVSPIWVVGLEADFQGALEKEHNTFGGPFTGFLDFATTFAPAAPTTVTGSTTIDYQTKIDWFGTGRGRVGYLWGDGAVLTYLTGGLAYGRVGIQGTSTVSGTVSNPLSGSFFNTQAFDQSHVNIGWVVGYGIEGKLLIPGWTYRIESLYMDLGTLDARSSLVSSSPAVGPTLCVVGVPCPPPTAGASGGGVTTHSHFTDGILRLGFNYQFH
jgi:outer membrane immunogenic protein